MPRPTAAEVLPEIATVAASVSTEAKITAPSSAVTPTWPPTVMWVSEILAVVLPVIRLTTIAPPPEIEVALALALIATPTEEAPPIALITAVRRAKMSSVVAARKAVTPETSAWAFDKISLRAKVAATETELACCEPTATAIEAAFTLALTWVVSSAVTARLPALLCTPKDSTPDAWVIWAKVPLATRFIAATAATEVLAFSPVAPTAIATAELVIVASIAAFELAVTAISPATSTWESTTCARAKAASTPVRVVPKNRSMVLNKKFCGLNPTELKARDTPMATVLPPPPKAWVMVSISARTLPVDSARTENAPKAVTLLKLTSARAWVSTTLVAILTLIAMTSLPPAIAEPPLASTSPTLCTKSAEVLVAKTSTLPPAARMA